MSRGMSRHLRKGQSLPRYCAMRRGPPVHLVGLCCYDSSVSGYTPATHCPTAYIFLVSKRLLDSDPPFWFTAFGGRSTGGLSVPNLDSDSPENVRQPYPAFTLPTMWLSDQPAAASSRLQARAPAPCHFLKKLLFIAPTELTFPCIVALLRSSSRGYTLPTRSFAGAKTQPRDVGNRKETTSPRSRSRRLDKCR